MRKIRRDLTGSPAKLPIVTVTRARDVVTIAWGDVDEKINLMVRSALLVAKREGQADRTVDLFAKHSSYSNGSTGYLAARLAFDPPFSPGDVALEVSVVLEEINKKRPDETRHFTLGTMKAEVLGAHPHPEAIQ